MVVTPTELIAGKVLAWHHRQGKPKAGTDWRDLAMLLLTFPEFKSEEGEVNDRLLASGASEDVMRLWKELVTQEISPETEEDEF